MLYRKFGNTGVKISILGFGSMRLPMEEKNGRWTVKEEESIKMIHYSFEQGVNYIDSAYMYCNGESEIIVGKALKGWREKVYVSTKIPVWEVGKTSDYRMFLEKQLKKLDVDYIDFYHLHGLNEKTFNEKVLHFDLIREAEKAKQEGLIKHISFSFHDRPEIMKKIIDSGPFETVLCQYNLLDRVNEESIAYAHSKGVGVVVMGPVGGGRLSTSDVLINVFKGAILSTPEIALRFVFSNENVSVALSGMGNIKMVEENVHTASKFNSLTKKEKELLDNFIEERRKKEEIPCTACRYCQPCPQGVAIPEIFQLMNYYTIYGLKKFAIEQYANIGKNPDDKRKKADACIECKKCEEVCPQKIKITDHLKKIHKILSSQ